MIDKKDVFCNVGGAKLRENNRHSGFLLGICQTVRMLPNTEKETI